MFTGIRPSLGLGLALALLAGCAPVATQTAAETSAINYVPGELNQESVFDLLTAELAGQQRDFDLAYQLYLRQAELNRSAVLAERATRIAQFKRDPEAVIESARLWLELAPQSVEPPQILINILLHESRVAEALELLSKQKSIGPELLLVVESLLNSFDDESAMALAELLTSRLQATPDQLDLLLVVARLRAQLGESDLALELINQGLTIEPSQPDLIVEKAQLLRQKTQSAEALRLVESVLGENRDHRQLRAIHVQLLLELKPASVAQAVEQALNQADRDPQLVYYYALLLLENDKPSQSLALFNELLLADPERTDLNLYIGINQAALDNSEAALAAFSKVEGGDLIFAAVSRALELLDIDTEFDRARSLVDQARSSDTERASQLAIIFAHWASENDALQRGLDYLAELIAKDPNDVSLLFSRALMIEPLNPQQMMTDLERAYALDPDNAGTQNALGYSLLEHSDQYERAYKLIKRALNESPDEPAYLDSMGWALHKLNRNDEALAYLERAFEQMPDPEVSSHLIIVLIELKQLERAGELLDEQEALHPDNEDLAEARRWFER